MKNLTYWLILTALPFIFGCSAKSEDVSYELSQNNCSTGKHSFSSKAAECDALKDSAVNNGCAEDLRKQTFASECPGQAWAPAPSPTAAPAPAPSPTPTASSASSANAATAASLPFSTLESPGLKQPAFPSLPKPQAQTSSSQDFGNQNEISFEFSENGCLTGKHIFSSPALMCQGLKDESLNQGCARDLRQQQFNTDCPNQTWNEMSY